MTDIAQRRFTISLSERTIHFLKQLEIPNRSSYIELLILKNWASMDCEHQESSHDFPACYAHNALKMLTPKKDLSEKSNLQVLRLQLCIASLSLTLDSQEVFGAKNIRLKLQSLLGNLLDKLGAKAGSIMPGDAVEGSKYSSGYDCLQIVMHVKRPTYQWLGFNNKDSG